MDSRASVSASDETPATSPSPWAAAGVSDFDEALYHAILHQPEAGITGWSRLLGASPPRVRRACARLLRLGLIQAPDSTGGLRPVDPRIAVRALIRKRESESDLLAATADDMAKIYAAGLLRAEPSSLVEVVRGESANAARLEELYARAEHEVCLFDSPPYLAPLTPQLDLQSEVLRRGVAYRTVYSVTSLESPDLLAYAEGMVALGEQARVLPTVPMKLLVVDRRTAMLPLTSADAGPAYCAVIVRHSALTDALQTLFETFWQQGTPLSGTPDDGGEELSAADRRLIGLLAAGMKDEAIARHLGVSLRTLRRRVSDLQLRLAAAGRFQAGVRAAQRGWA
ncbi:response regulator transcription factor [Streptomyces sp. 110]|uniref:Response regulator transcription factor n=1 Tax=Streptomyces endocoffeicus TaxID=2898945 RepID=A0ABS1PWP8_9ACTN|nr:response regulator transcription factor [Streptomyces endocoffeicus]MBL1116550.1 response regulator transcription factor [Streptomyces endocoffeicus]